MKRLKFFYTIIIFAALAACNGDEFLNDVKPDINQAKSEFEDNVTLDNLVRAAYFDMKSPAPFGPMDLLLYQDIASDILEQKSYSQTLDGWDNLQALYLRQPEMNDITMIEFPWAGAYQMIYSTNTVLDFYAKNGPIDDSEASWVPRMKGESHFLRAYAYYLLATTFAPPYISNPKAPCVILRTEPSKSPTDLSGLSTNEEVYSQIISDLKQAIELLPEDYNASIHPSNYQDRVKRDGARFLLAKTYFLMGRWGNTEALEQINKIIDSGKYPLYEGDDLYNIFKPKGLGEKVSETVWYATYYYRNAWRAPLFEKYYSNFTGGGKLRGLAFSKATLQEIGWDDEATAKLDKRYVSLYRRYEADGSGEKGADPTFAGQYEDVYNVWCQKFKDKTSNFVVFRSPELYLMRAVIRLTGGNASGAADDVNLIRERAGLAPSGSVTEVDIEKEWIKEYAFEGRRLFYLQALKKNIPAGDRPGVAALPYDDPSLVRKLPRSELTRNPSLQDNSDGSEE